MRFLIIGCGSMGQRRIRCLQTLGYSDIWVYDTNKDNLKKVCDKYNVSAADINIGCIFMDYVVLNGHKGRFGNLMRNVETGEYTYVKCADAMLICTPPGTKQQYIDLANNYNIPAFCEADIQTYSGEYYPSRTLVYHPAIKKIKETLDSGKLGKVYTFAYHMGQHIMDWHPGADMKTYYAAQKETGAAREMFCFELAWLSWLFGSPIDATGFIDKKLSEENVTANDVYSTVVTFEKKQHLKNIPMSWNDHEIKRLKIEGRGMSTTGTILIDIVSRPAIREIRIAGEKGTLEWNWNDGYIRVTVVEQGGILHPKVIKYRNGQAAEGYHSAICEDMYVDEVIAFIADITNKRGYGYTKKDEEKVIAMLQRVEGRHDTK